MEKILCVDDDRGVLQLYDEELTDEGYKVILAKDGKEALSKYSKEKPDLVSMDIRMPGMNGLDVLTAILGKDRCPLRACPRGRKRQSYRGQT